MSMEWMGIIILSVVLAIVLFAYERLVRQVARMRREKMEEEKKARIEAEKTVKEARDKAVEIISEANVNADKWRQLADQEMEKMTSQQLSEYKEKLQKISIGIEEGVKSGTENLKETLEKEAEDVERTVVKKIEDGLAGADREVGEYREEKIKQINDKAEEVLETVVKKIFGKAIKLADHETLILNALEEAKKENAI